MANFFLQKIHNINVIYAVIEYWFKWLNPNSPPENFILPQENDSI